MGINPQNIRPVQTNYVIESSTETKHNCIIGTIKLIIFLLDKDGHFYDTDVVFLVANNTIKLSDVILGTVWLRSHEATLVLKQEYSLQLKLKDKHGT